MKYPDVELLAPAGCYPSLHAAIDNGADAVYFGLSQLNMRARSRRSFDDSDLADICRICREAGVKTNLAINTLMYEHDLKMVRKLLEEAKVQQVDAVIVADMATMTIAEELGLEVHLSTQLSLSNSESIKFYAPHCDRVVLARELSLPMIKKIHQRIIDDNITGRAGKLMEIEAFAHGALCVAVSGRCSMSLYTDNASANRGACDQNCRKEYIVKDVESGEELLVDNNYVMSPTDILTIDFIDDMLDAGVRIFKLEGRGRSPEYVANVTKAYRTAIDAVQDGTYTQDLVEELKPSLEKVYNRGFSSGYYLGKKQGWSEVNGTKATHRKDYIGTISNYFSKAGVIEIENAALEFSTGDEYVIIGDTTGAVEGTAGEIRVDEDGAMVAVDSAPRTSTFSMAHTGEARRRDRLYRMTPIKAAVDV
jgi:putative protease|tara:strand:+ start:1178 stop:2443 length:1266 start_codon:yes stop_codon:yes gene_type:complete